MAMSNGAVATSVCQPYQLAGGVCSVSGGVQASCTGGGWGVGRLDVRRRELGHRRRLRLYGGERLRGWAAGARPGRARSCARAGIAERVARATSRAAIGGARQRHGLMLRDGGAGSTYAGAFASRFRPLGRRTGAMKQTVLALAVLAALASSAPPSATATQRGGAAPGR